MIEKSSFFLVSSCFIWLLIIGLVFSVSCQKTKTTIINTPSTQPTMASKPISPTATISSKTATTITFTSTPSVSPSPTTIGTNTYTPTPNVSSTVSPIKKVAVLPIIATNFTLSPDSNLLATVDKDTGILYVYSTVDWDLKWEIEEENRGMTGYVLDFSPDGNLLAGSGTEQDVYIWDMNTGETIYRFTEPYDTVNSVSFSHDGKFLAVSTIETYSSPYRVMIWDMETGQKLPDQFSATDYGWYIVKTNFVPNESNIIAMMTANFRLPENFEEGHKTGGLYFWEIENQVIYEAISGTHGIALGLSPNGHLATVQIDNHLRVWDMQDAKEILNIKLEEDIEIGKMSLTDTGLIATIDSNWVLRVWNLKGELLTMVTSDEIISDIAFSSSDELFIAYLLNENPIEVWMED